MSTTDDIWVNPGEAAGQYSGASRTYEELHGQIPEPHTGLRPGVSTAMSNAFGDLKSGASTSAGLSHTGADAATAMGDTDQASGGKIKGGPDLNDPTGAGGRGGPGTPRLSAADLARAGGASPYNSLMPISQTAQAIPGLAQSIPGILTSPVQSATAPIQSMLSGAGGPQMLTQMLGNAHGGDGGPASLSLVGDNTTATGAKMHALASSVLGIPYAWGGGDGNGPTRGISDGGGPADRAGDYKKVGYDCSGLARYVTAQLHGVELPHSSQTQFAMGIPVSASQAQPGDLVFPAYAGRPPQHVQVWLGGGQVLEAPSSGQTVKVSQLSAGSAFRRFG